VLVEPVQSADPDLHPREFLQKLRQLTRDRQIVMVMDEVISGFRAAPGGAQEYFDVWGDMATYGKILGGGLPIGALAGKAEYMDALDGGTWKYEDTSEPEADMTFLREHLCDIRWQWPPPIRFSRASSPRALNCRKA
jgi:glutamate-1-semialdehyde aminotransferase